jgi:hypothetical protein
MSNGNAVSGLKAEPGARRAFASRTTKTSAVATTVSSGPVSLSPRSVVWTEAARELLRMAALNQALPFADSVLDSKSWSEVSAIPAAVAVVRQDFRVVSMKTGPLQGRARATENTNSDLNRRASLRPY